MRTATVQIKKIRILNHEILNPLVVLDMDNQITKELLNYMCKEKNTPRIVIEELEIEYES